MKISAAEALAPPDGWTELVQFMDAAADDGASPITREAAKIGPWILRFVCAPLPWTGESRLVCPALPPSIESGLLFCVVSQTSTDAVDQLTDELLAQRASYLAYRARLPSAAQRMLALIVLFPLLSPRCYAVLDEVKRRTNALFTSDGLSCREFYPGNADRSLRCPEVPIAQSTVPAFAMRPIQRLDGVSWTAFTSGGDVER